MSDLRVLNINADDWEPFECSNMLLAVMAFPATSQVAERQKAFEALCARGLYEAHRLDADQRPFLNLRLNSYLELQTDKEANRLSKKVKRILNQRSQIAFVAEPWIDRLSDKTGSIRTQPLTDAVLKERLYGFLPEGASAEMWVRRVWRPARPVFPLFAAYHKYASHLGAEYLDPFNNRSQTTRAPDGPTGPTVAKLAMRFQERLCAHRVYRFRREELIWLDWTDAAVAVNRSEVPADR